MSIRPYQQAYDAVIRMMAECLVLPPAVEPYRLGECMDRWREQRIAEICINEFGDDARAKARRLLEVAGAAGHAAPVPPAQLSCGSGKHFTESADGLKGGPLPMIGSAFADRALGEALRGHAHA